MKAVGIADLKARLSAHLRSVRGGGAIVVMDRSTPVAKIVPISPDPLEVRLATKPPSALKARPVARATNSLAVLLADRSRR
jgi:prevent-host-death family protein